MGKAPCANCTERYLACHANCEAYKDWKAEHDDIMRKARLAREPNYVALNRFWRIKLLLDGMKG